MHEPPYAVFAYRIVMAKMEIESMVEKKLSLSLIELSGRLYARTTIRIVIRQQIYDGSL